METQTLADAREAQAAGAETQAMRELAHINTPIAQTWNYLRVNDLTLNVLEPQATGKVYEAVPRIFDAIDAGIGEEAARWVVAAAGNGRYVEVPRGTVREEPIVVAPATGETENVAVMVRSGASAQVVVVATGAGTADGAAGTDTAAGSDAATGSDAAANTDAAAGANAAATSAALVRIYVERGAQLSMVEVVACGAEQQHLEGVGIRAEEGASVEVRQYALGGSTVGLGLACDLAGSRSRLDLSCRYHASGEGLVDVNHLTRMRGRDSRAEMHASGVLADSAHKTVRQTIDLVHGAKGAQGNENDTTLVTGDDVVNKTLPTILCDEEDVAGNHGATIGSVSEEQLSYLAARGLSREEAEALFVRAIFDDAVINAPEATSRAAAIARAEAVLGPDVAHEISEGLESESDQASPASTSAVPADREV